MKVVTATSVPRVLVTARMTIQLRHAINVNKLVTSLQVSVPAFDIECITQFPCLVCPNGGKGSVSGPTFSENHSKGGDECFKCGKSGHWSTSTYVS